MSMIFAKVEYDNPKLNHIAFGESWRELTKNIGCSANTITEIDTDKLYENMNAKYSELLRSAIDIIEIEARKLMIKHLILGEFVMAMGSAFFIHKDSEMMIKDEVNRIINLNKYKYLHKFEELIDNLNNQFNILGYPMRFTAYGEVINNW